MKIKQTTKRNKLMRPSIVTFYFISALVQLLVLTKMIPYTWVNGGMSKSYETQAVQSLLSLVIICVLYLFVYRILKSNQAVGQWGRYTLYVVTAFWIIGLIMQVIGTPFERFILSAVLLIGVISHMLLIKQVRSIYVA